MYTVEANLQIDKHRILKRIRKLGGRGRASLENTIAELIAISNMVADEWIAHEIQNQLDREHQQAIQLAQIAALPPPVVPIVGDHRVDNLGNEWVWDGRVWLWFNNAHQPMPPLVPIAAVPPPPVAFTQDRQNVHRTETVEYILNMFKQLERVPVAVNQNTISDIIRECGLSGRAIITLTVYYYDPTPIYEIPNAYPRALDAIWAFIQTHPEKAELVGRVRDELTDNIGMCAQGNLSRLCNILSGYMEGATPPRPRHEILQEGMAAIAGDDSEDKLARAEKLLAELEVPPGDWAAWLSAF